MIRDTSLLEEYPFKGTFYRIEVDKSVPLAERKEERKVVLETKCDIEENHHTDDGGFISATFKVFFPFCQKKGISIRRGDSFEGDMYGMYVSGEVVGVFPTTLGGCEVYIRDFDA